MYIKRKTCDIRTWKKTFISRHILHQHWYTCPIALSVRWNPQRKSLLTVVSANSATPVSTSSSSAKRMPPSCEPLYATNTSHRKHETFLMNILCTESFSQHNKTLLVGSTLFKHGRQFDYWNQPLNMRMRLCYLDCHEAGLCCYLVIHRKALTSITNVLLPFVTYLLILPRIIELIISTFHSCFQVHLKVLVWYLFCVVATAVISVTFMLSCLEEQTVAVKYGSRGYTVLGLKHAGERAMLRETEL
jgi:hypothetical protein